MTPREAREHMLRTLRDHTIGPLDGEAECIAERPVDRYHTGYLCPPHTTLNPEENQDDRTDDTRQQDQVGAGDGVFAMANCAHQSAMGLTFHIARDGDHQQRLEIAAGWALYHPIREETPGDAGEEIQGDDKPGERRRRRQPGPVIVGWQREPHATGSLFLLPGREHPVGRHRLWLEKGVELEALVRQREAVWTITVSLVNRRERPGRDEDHNLYQAWIRVIADDDTSLVTAPPAAYVRDTEFWNHEILYRDVRQFAVGHGVAVQWDVDPDDIRQARRIWTEWIPATEVWKASADILGDLPALSLDHLADASDRAGIRADLETLTDHYANWIADREREIPGITGLFSEGQQSQIRQQAEANLAQCRDALARMREGIALLTRDDIVWRAFVLMNRAMAASMRRTRDAPPRWRAFQLAFILLALPSTVQGNHRDREVLDLIWFPTGGGKTEAYLGLTVLCILHRRLSYDDPDRGAGTSVITRYTLRLLTIQQFERAARAICACEVLRRENPDELGTTPFSIGLFIGGGGTPNRLEEARKILNGEDLEGGQTTTLPLRECPWCSTRLETGNQQIDRGRLITRCPDNQCDFRESIPISIIDDEIYAYPPTMIIGTVDKFAMMAWEEKIRVLFGHGPGGFPPPDMIIQDELHLIGDALGTITALYETAVDHLCTREGIKPKIIGSTATIRRAREQGQALFTREARQFPPNGTGVDDSFFNRLESSTPGRLYVGVHAQGRSPKHTLARVMGVLSQASTSIADTRLRDPYHTLVTYFNSLRELGGALVLAEDDVRRYIASMPLPADQRKRNLKHIQELTSHLPSSMIPEVLDQMKEGLDGDSEDLEPLDLVLSTNMISVGVDVDRLGLMIVNGQPKTTAEYIQASSRVGRPAGSAGMVVTIYNWTRPRDRSHYERFVGYHQGFYRYVEATSVTPFSSRARDRALHAVLVSMGRLMFDDLADNRSPGGWITCPENDARLARLTGVILDRCNSVDSRELEDLRDDLERLIGRWRGEARAKPNVTWKGGWAGKGIMLSDALLRRPTQDAGKGLWATPQSMRDVDPPSPVLLMTRKGLEQAQQNHEEGDDARQER
ncbi:MAG: helicase-related protein [Pseudomonadota bacterium]|nr:helicase-related protein [Pseudomonadota bacterium]